MGKGSEKAVTHIEDLQKAPSESPPVYSYAPDEAPAGISSGTFEQHMENTSIPLLTSKDIIIGVMGITGVGKSTFISYFSQTAKIGEGLESCTIDVGVHQAHIGDQKIYLIDTPGFDDTHRRDADVLREIADWLNRMYKARIQLAGIVYLHRITDTRMGGSALKNLRMFRKLCGPKGLPCVVLATTMWSTVTAEDGERRERELMHNQSFWGEMINHGSVVMRQDQEEVSAITIIQYILGQRRRMVLDIQEEMASGKTLDETGAGRELEAELERLKKQHDTEMRELREDMIEAQKANNQRAQAEIASIRDDLQKKMDQDKEDRERMRVTMEELKKERDEELRQEREKHRERELAHEKAKAENEMKIRMMELDTAHMVEVAELRLMRNKADAEVARWEAANAERTGGCSVM